MTGGMDNPVGVAFTVTGERILCATFLQEPAGGKRDGLIHAIYGGVYGKVHDVIDEHPRTGDILPVLSHLGPAAPCSLICYHSDIFGHDFQNNLFTCCFNLHKVLRHQLVPDGATYKTIDTDFLTSDDPDFHPTCVLEDADGSLIVIDTGGWYNFCCPTSQLAKPDVLGHIYRVRRRGAPKIEDPRGHALKWASLTPSELANLLSDPRPVVRQRAIRGLAKSGGESLRGSDNFSADSAAVEVRRNALWALTRIDSAQAREAARGALHDPDHTFATSPPNPSVCGGMQGRWRRCCLYCKMRTNRCDAWPPRPWGGLASRWPFLLSSTLRPRSMPAQSSFRRARAFLKFNHICFDGN